jgi:hypothetical protein
MTHQTAGDASELGAIPVTHQTSLAASELDKRWESNGAVARTISIDSVEAQKDEQEMTLDNIIFMEQHNIISWDHII